MEEFGFDGPRDGVQLVQVPPFTPACDPRDSCIPQQGTFQRLAAQGDRLMGRLAYRRFADGRESFVATHSVAARGAASGVRWYELSPNPEGMSVVQSGTFAPDGAARWMGSIAMDKLGNIAVGYNVSGSGMNPSVRYTGHRVAGDDTGMLSVSEKTVVAGGSSQLSGVLWGSSSMAVDPVDDCTFWLTGEYVREDGANSTRVASFKFSACQSVSRDATPRAVRAWAHGARDGRRRGSGLPDETHNVKGGGRLAGSVVQSGSRNRNVHLNLRPAPLPDCPP